MHKAGLWSAILAGALSSLVGVNAHAQQMGTVFLDFDGHNGAPQGNVTALDAARFPGLAAGDTNNLIDAILAKVQADYAAFSINIVKTDPGGVFTRVVVGDEGTQSTGALGVANEIDFRNKRRANIVSVLGKVHADPPVVANYTLEQAAQFMANTTSHELGHVLGLVHSDPVSTFEAGGGGAAGRTSVRTNEIMKAIQEDADAFRNLTFGSYSRLKLDISQGGINVQPEAGAAVFTGPFVADPARNGDAGATVAAGTVLTLDANRRALAVGNLGGADTTDVYTFTGVAGQRVTAEAFSQTLTDGDGAGTDFVGRIANPMDPVVALIDALGNVVAPEEYTTNFDFDGSSGGAGAADFGSDSLLFNFTIPANGLYGLRVTARGGGDATGDYELLFVPEPSSALLILAAVGLIASRRRRSAAA